MAYPDTIESIKLEKDFSSRLAKRRMTKVSEEIDNDYERIYKEGYVEGFNAALSWALTDLHAAIVDFYDY